MSRILIIDDEASICWAFREFLTDEGHLVDVAASAEEGLKIVEQTRPDAVVLDVRLPGIDGLSALPEFRNRIAPAPIVVMTAFGNLDTVVRAMEGGAFDYLVKPFDLDQASNVVKRALEKRRQSPPLSPPSVDLATRPETLIGSSSLMQELFKSIALVAPTDVPVLITGESGTGKELVARAIHRHSSRRTGPFLPICVPALSATLIEPELFGHTKGSFTGAVNDRKGLLELASGGTVLLDEVGDIPSGLQVKLLRAIEHHEVTPVGDARPRQTDIRVIAATNRPLTELMATGEFREDLFFRLSVFPIHLPPLRDRQEDIPGLAKHFLKLSLKADSAAFHLSDALIDELRSRHWAGNIRELRNALEHAAIVARGQTIRPEHLPPATRGSVKQTNNDIGPQVANWANQEVKLSLNNSVATPLYDRFLEQTEPQLLRAVLAACFGNRAKAAHVLGMHRATLRQKLNKYGLSK